MKSTQPPQEFLSVKGVSRDHFVAEAPAISLRQWAMMLRISCGNDGNSRKDLSAEALTKWPSDEE
jgi:hypothetical protein